MKRRRSTTTDSAPPMTRLEKFLARAAAEDRATQRRLARGQIWDGSRWVSARDRQRTGGHDDDAA